MDKFYAKSVGGGKYKVYIDGKEQDRLYNLAELGAFYDAVKDGGTDDTRRQALQ